MMDLIGTARDLSHKISEVGYGNEVLTGTDNATQRITVIASPKGAAIS